MGARPTPQARARRTHTIAAVTPFRLSACLMIDDGIETDLRRLLA